MLVISPGGHLESGDAIHDIVRFIAAPVNRVGSGGPASDIAIQAREIVKARERIARTIARETGKSLDVVLADIERDHWLSAEEAVDYGLVSRIIERKTELKGA
jgi:ATP-dependent Clp protease, protease subunit